MPRLISLEPYLSTQFGSFIHHHPNPIHANDPNSSNEEFDQKTSLAQL